MSVSSLSIFAEKFVVRVLDEWNNLLRVPAYLDNFIPEGTQKLVVS